MNNALVAENDQSAADETSLADGTGLTADDAPPDSPDTPVGERNVPDPGLDETADEEFESFVFAVPEGLPDGFEYAQDLADSFRHWAREAGLNEAQAKSLHDRYVRTHADQLAAVQRMQLQAETEARDALTRHWGEEDGQLFRRNIEFANRAIRNLGGDNLLDAMKAGGLLGPDGAVINETIALALARIGEVMFSEDSLRSGSLSEPNPWHDESEDLGRQADIIRSEPAKARALMRAAGLDPSDFGLS